MEVRGVPAVFPASGGRGAGEGVTVAGPLPPLDGGNCWQTSCENGPVSMLVGEFTRVLTRKHHVLPTLTHSSTLTRPFTARLAGT
jgi:hypothetical protein